MQPSNKKPAKTPKGEGFKLNSKRTPASKTDDSPPPVAANIATKVKPQTDEAILPRSYGFETLFLIAQDPHWLFTYWDIDISRHPGGQTFLRCYRKKKEIEKEIEVPFETRNWYIPVTEAGATYHVELGYYRGEVWNPIASSESVETPPDNLSESEHFDFATVPLHLSFSKLMDNIQQSIQSGESLVSALSRLQRDGKLLPLQTSDLADLGADERQVLESLLGKDFINSFAGSSGNHGDKGSSSVSSHDLQELIRTRLEERLNSEGGSEWLNSWGGAKAESSLFGVLQFISGPSSWSTGALSTWAAAALTSWAAAARGVTSSWGPESLASWLQAAAGQASWSSAALTSWSEQGGGVAGLTSWESGSTSSWNEQPFGREFFMHVNAELIFYGGTHPKASVTIDGKPITLAADGTFRYHFVFPNGDYEVPIVATSPDGVETRRAVLRFERETGKSGIVTDTPQPPLGEPMGKR